MARKSKKKSDKEIGLEPLYALDGKWTRFELVAEKKDQKRMKKSLDQRMKYGVGNVDTWGLDNSLARIIANALFLFVYQSKDVVMDVKDCRDGGGQDYSAILKHAKAIREWAEADSWDSLKPRRHRLDEYKIDMSRFMQRLAENEALKKAGKKIVSYPMKPRKSLYSDSWYKEKLRAYKIFQTKKKAWKEAMLWLTENWKGLWW